MYPLGPGRWLARCECGTTHECADAAGGWEWVLGHPCPPEPTKAGHVVDLTEPAGAPTDSSGGSGI